MLHSRINCLHLYPVDLRYCWLLLAGILLSCITATAQLTPAQQSAQFQEHRLQSIRSKISSQHPQAFTAMPIMQNNVPKPYARRAAQHSIPKHVIADRSAIQQPPCMDTSGKFYLKEDSTGLYINDIMRTRDGNILFCGEYPWRYQPRYIESGYLGKCDEYGHLLWAKRYDTANTNSYFSYYKLLELASGNLLLIGVIYDIKTQGNPDMIVTQTDAMGNIIWSKIYHSRLWQLGLGSEAWFDVKDVKEDPEDGSLYISGEDWKYGRMIIRLNPKDGRIIWSRKYEPIGGAGLDKTFGLDIKGDELRSFGNLLGYNDTSILALHRIDKKTGDLIASKYFKITDTPYASRSFLWSERLVKLNNGHFAISGIPFGYWKYQYDFQQPLFQATMIEIDDNLNIVKGYCLRNKIESNGGNSRITMFPDGSGLFTMLHYYSGYVADIYFVQFKDGTILNQRKRYYVNEGVPQLTYALQLPDGGQLMAQVIGDSVKNEVRDQFLKLHTSDTSSFCLGEQDTATFIEPVHLESTSFRLDTVRQNVFQEDDNKTLLVYDEGLTYEPGCKQTSFCDALKIHSPKDTFCINTTLVFTATKNKECGTAVTWQYDTAAVYTNRLSDTTLSLTFTKPWQGKLYGRMDGCTALADSVTLVALPALGKVDLGPDTSLCPGNTVVLRAGSGYKNYQWSTGAEDSIISITQPGTYSVTVSNACGDTFSDAIVIRASAPVPLDIGPDIVKCNIDTVTISAPKDFINYSWSSSGNMLPTTGNTIKVFPGVTTRYTLKAEKTKGCFAYDTVLVTVNHSPAINLGGDTSFCSGDSLVIDAGNSFTNYQWNTGAATQKVIAKATSSYYVTATDANNCTSSDTISIMVYNNPVVRLSKDSLLCSGNTLLLDAGAGFNSYQWSTGSNTAAITVNATGKWWVTVQDAHGCSGTDTSSIKQIVPLPAGFLPPDTALCAYALIAVGTTKSFNTYLWNNSSTEPRITISKAGKYSLQVKDEYGCIGRDTITINAKQCLQGLFVPSAFTPNHDGINDVFRPLLFGNVLRFTFQVSNRWGQIIFQTSDVAKSWDGKVNGVDLDAGTFIWRCIYQLQDQKIQEQHGTFTLIK